MGLYQSLFHSKASQKLNAEERMLQRMLLVEACLAAAQAEEGIIPAEAANVIAGCCNVNFIDIPKLKESIPLGGNAAIPLVKQLLRTVKNNDFEASKYVHLGATSQDIIDTGFVLGIKEAYELFEKHLGELGKKLAALVSHHQDTIMIGRTLFQQAKPITFGLKAAYWLKALSDAQERLKESKARVLQVQLAGAVGSSSNYLNANVRKRLAKKLGLQDGIPWHTNRTHIAEWASDLGILAGVLGKIAKDITLLMQTEVAEAFEGAMSGKGGSSTMPHKRNPVTCSAITANTHRIPHLIASIFACMPQEHERAAGLWHAEWEVADEITSLTLGALEKTIHLIENLEVDKERMLSNLELTKGLIYAENVFLALAPIIGKGNAHEWVQKACKIAIHENKHLKEVVQQSEYNLHDIDNLFNPKNSIGNSKEIIDEILNHYEHQL